MGSNPTYECLICGETDVRMFRRNGRKNPVYRKRCDRCLKKYGAERLYAKPLSRNGFGKLLWTELESMVGNAYAPVYSVWERNVDGACFVVRGIELTEQRLERLEPMEVDELREALKA